jgi:hypothetical protein
MSIVPYAIDFESMPDADQARGRFTVPAFQSQILHFSRITLVSARSPQTEELFSTTNGPESSLGMEPPVVLTRISDRPMLYPPFRTIYESVNSPWSFGEMFWHCGVFD